MPCRALTLLTIVVLGALITTRARADETKAARVVVDAPASCATEATFWKALSRRTDRVAPSSASSTRIDVVIREARTSVVGEITLSERGQRSERRKIAGASCEEVTSALSVVAALAFDPAARIDAEPNPSPASTTNELAAPAPTQNVQTARVEGPPTKAAPAHDADAPVGERTENRAASSLWRLGVGVTGGVHALGAATLAYGAFVDLDRELAQGSAGFAPSFRLGGFHTEGSQNGSEASADLSFSYARALACPLRIDPVRTLSFRPCAGLDAGVVSAHATGVAKTNDRSRPWLAPSTLVRLTWAPVRPIFVELAGGLSVPLVRDEFAVDPRVSIYRAPIVVPLAEIAAGVRFW